MTRRVLIAWEFGSGLGHIACLWPIIQALRGKGVEPLVAVPDPDKARSLLGAEAPRMIRVPHFPQRIPRVKPQESFADLLLDRGFRDPGALDPAIAAWRTIYREERIETVLLDYAHVAQTAAWLDGLRMITRSTTFANPPVPLPAFQPASPTSRRAAQAGERELVECVNRVAKKAGRKPIESLAEWLHAPYRFATGIPETNVYDFEPEGGYLGPSGRLPNLEKIDWEGKRETRVLCYLRWSEETVKLVEALAREDRELLCAIPGADPDWMRTVSTRGVRMSKKLLDVSSAMTNAHVVISNGSGGLTCEVTLARKPHLILAIDWEKELLAQRAIALGIAARLPSNRDLQQFPDKLEALVDGLTEKINSDPIPFRSSESDWSNALGLLSQVTASE